MLQSTEFWVWPPAGQPIINPQDSVMKWRKVMESCFKYKCSTFFFLLVVHSVFAKLCFS